MGRGRPAASAPILNELGRDQLRTPTRIRPLLSLLPQKQAVVDSPAVIRTHRSCDGVIRRGEERPLLRSGAVVAEGMLCLGGVLEAATHVLPGG